MGTGDYISKYTDELSASCDLSWSQPKQAGNQMAQLGSWAANFQNWLSRAKLSRSNTTVLIQSIHRSHITRGPKSTKSGKVTGHRRWWQNPQRGWENAKLCLQLNLMSIFLCLLSLITAFSSVEKNYGKTGQLACSLTKISSGHTFLGDATKPKVRHIGHRSQGMMNWLN